ncbi:GNAT family N-acetyltransferase [Jeotgalibacillus sp. ET6]|uniref:GNAT family N-acetyltransferase n=1 Tax=Jeotgalibacillus sp. ET6 TaxID=3037260 RepID=UPI002418458F|nr:GNAT family N-acetyltransferase [Jeotgalibacillus sp. ET6]MDG5472282.1 GNAT family N-acetyltransferase [Jeotgalibacillus sp. ET6]
MIYFQEDDLLIRPMIERDIQQFVSAFSQQGWHKPVELYEDYYQQQNDHKITVLVAEIDHQVAGYAILLPSADKGPFASENFSELIDLNVLIKFQNKGIGGKIMDAAESLSKEKHDFITLAVGLHSGYGAAQRMYIKRGYIPDGSGVWYRGQQAEQYSACENDDDLVLYLSKKL